MISFGDLSLKELADSAFISPSTRKMLQQILNDMWVDPEILAELDESQKQTLFCKMREEQVRRWKIWDAANPPKPKTTSKKKVDFRLDEKGEPWTWVMGEHPSDKTIEEILEEEARDAARRLAEAERLAELLEQNKRQREEIEVAQQKLDAEEIYCSADELRIDVKPVLPVVNRLPPVQSTNLRRDALQEISFNKLPKVSQQVALWEKRVVEERTSEIYKKIQKMKLEAVKEAEEAENKHEHFWREQQKKAKEEEQRRREIARIAREEHRRSMQDIEPETPAIPPRKDTSNPSKPPNKDAIVEWFKSSQVNRKAGLDPNTNSVASWFHGLITRQEAENLLSPQPVGSFLVRVSERIWGYAISYKDTDRCKHYLIDASNDHYQFLGTNQISHKTLGDLVTYHANRPITEAGGELLGRACHRTKPLPLVFQALSIRAR